MILCIPATPDPEREAVAAAWTGSIMRIERFWEPPPMDASRVRLYGNETFCLVLAQKLGLELISPPDDLLPRMSAQVLKRWVRQSWLDQVTDFPTFVKPLVPKVFRAATYQSADELAQECRDLPPATPVLVSEVVLMSAEARAFVLNGQVVTCALYQGEQDGARPFLETVAPHPDLPHTCVLDAAYIEGRGWALLEANATWGAGLNGCEPEAVARCLRVATQVGP